jgi:hypothetical protein
VKIAVLATSTSSRIRKVPNPITSAFNSGYLKLIPTKLIAPKLKILSG